MTETRTCVPTEIALTAAESYRDPFHDVEVYVRFTDPTGATRRVPAFWAGDGVWKARYASPVAGTHAYRSECSAPTDAGLHGAQGEIVITPYEGGNPLFARGPIRISEDRRHFVYRDGKPFFWLGDTWWMGLCRRLRWPDEFAQLTDDRVGKGFTVVQIVAGLYPDMPPFDPRGANEAGFPWEEGYARIRPEYFDMADRRLYHLVESGIVPCIVGMWGYFLPWMGVERAKQHWRYLIARYGAWPVVWCIAGEANLPYYLTEGFPFDDREQVHGWTEVMRYVRDNDPWHRPISIHPTGLGRLTARGATDDESLLDFDMLQTGHGLWETLAPTVETMRRSRAAEPRMPVLNSEVSYEALMDRIPAEIVRLMFWTSMLSGAAGHTYGANGIWQCNRREMAHGASPHGGNYGTIPWDEAMRLPGSGQLGAAKRLLEEYAWHAMEPRPDGAEWESGGSESEYRDPYAADLGAETRIVYAPEARPIRVRGLTADADYRTILFDPAAGTAASLPDQKTDSRGQLTLADPGYGHDWAVILQVRRRSES
jgi:hypothetical protein